MPNGVIPSWIPVPPVVGVTYTSPDGTLAVVFDGAKFVAVPPSDILSLADAIAIRDAVDADAAAAAASEAVASAAAVSALDFPDGQVVAYYNALKSIERKCTQVFNFADEQYGYYDLATLTFKRAPVAEALTVVRASTATVNHPQGLVTYPTNGLRIAYDPTTGERLVALVERSATNLLLHSQYTAASGETPPTGWAIGFNTGVTTTVTSPRFAGAIRATQSGTVQREFYEQLNVPVVAGNTYTLSAYFTAATSTSGVILAVVPMGGAVLSGTINLNATSFVAEGVYSITFTVTSGTLINVRVGLGCAGNATGTVIHETPQLTATAFPVSYIPTTTATATRAADDVSKAILGFSGGFAFMIESDFSKGINISASHAVFGVGNTTLGFSSTATIYLGFPTNGQSLILNTIGQTVSNSIVISNVTNNQRFYKVAIGYDGVNIKTFVDGVLVNSRVLTNPVAQPNQLKFGSPWELSTGMAQGAYIHKHAQYSPRAFTDAELISWSRQS